MASFTMPSYLKFLLLIISQVIAISANSYNYIINMDLSVMPKAFLDHHNWYLATVSSVLDNSKSITTISTQSPSHSKLIYSYNHVIHGFSAHLSPSELKALKNSPGFISYMRDLPVRPDTTHSFQFLGLDAPSGIWSASNYGKDVIIGVVDTGVWPESESYKDDGMTNVPAKWKGKCESGTQFNSSLCNKKLIGARFFNKGLLATNPNLTISMNSARDTRGHGTHTSSTAAGSYVKGASFFGYAPGTARGVAPMAQIAMYKALWEEGSYASDVIAAIDRAIIDGVDVMSLSLGYDGVPLHQDPIAVATFAAIKKGIFVSTSAGNYGPDYGSLHNGIPWVITVAASDMDRQFGGTITLGNGVIVIGTTLFPGDPSSISKTSIFFLDHCNNSVEMNKARNKIVVCQVSNGSIIKQIDNVRMSRSVCGVFITNDNLYIRSSFPVVFLTPKDGETLKDYIKSTSHPNARIQFRKTLIGIKPAPKIASYSSRGPSPSCPTVLKPDITGPGSLVLAAWPPNLPAATVNSQNLYTNYNLLSGTSMSCPHVAGVAALLRAVHKEWSPAAIRSAIMTTANLTDNTNTPIKDIGDSNQPATPLAMGAGHINPSKALDPGLIYDATSEDYVDFLCALNYTWKQIQAVTGTTSNNCSNPTLDLNYPSFIAFFNSDNASLGTRKVQEFYRTMTNIGDGSSTYTANITPLKGFKVSVKPRKLAFKGKNDKQSYKLSIEGLAQMKDIVAFGFISWIESKGKYVVTSPIVATSLSSKPLR